MELENSQNNALAKLPMLKHGEYEIEDFKTKNKSLESSNNHFKEANNELSKTNQLNDIVYKTGQSVQTMNMLNRNCKTSFAKDAFIKKAQKGNSRPQISKLNADLEQFHLCLKEEMVADLRYFNSLEHEVDTLKSQLETKKTQFLNEIDRLSREYYYADHMNAILDVYTDLDEFTNLQCDYVETWEKCERLEKELSKSRKMLINLELDLQQCKEKIKNDKSFKENQSNVLISA
ncbi:hypothetical protein Tco_0143151 [Tanacetum coccineum]